MRLSDYGTPRQWAWTIAEGVLLAIGLGAFAVLAAMAAP